MTINNIVSELMRREGKKKQVNRAQMSEIVGCISDMLFENYNHLGWDPKGNTEATNWMDIVLWNNGKARLTKKHKPVNKKRKASRKKK